MMTYLISLGLIIITNFSDVKAIDNEQVFKSMSCNDYDAFIVCQDENYTCLGTIKNNRFICVNK